MRNTAQGMKGPTESRHHNSSTRTLREKKRGDVNGRKESSRGNQREEGEGEAEKLFLMLILLFSVFLSPSYLQVKRKLSRGQAFIPLLHHHGL